MKNFLFGKCSWILLFLLLGCGGAKFKAGEPWDPNEEPFFDDGIDLVEDYSSLSGAWAYRQENNFEGRVQLADLIGIVEVESIQTATDHDGKAAKRIDVRVTKTLFGMAPASEIQLFSLEESPGHELILRYENRLNGTFIVFIRWFEDEGNKIKHHFHLSPDSEVLKAEINKRLKAREREQAVRESQR